MAFIGHFLRSNITIYELITQFIILIFWNVGAGSIPWPLITSQVDKNGAQVSPRSRVHRKLICCFKSLSLKNIADAILQRHKYKTMLDYLKKGEKTYIVDCKVMIYKLVLRS